MGKNGKKAEQNPMIGDIVQDTSTQQLGEVIAKLKNGICLVKFFDGKIESIMDGSLFNK